MVNGTGLAGPPTTRRPRDNGAPTRLLGGLAMVAMTTGGRSGQAHLGDSNWGQLRRCPWDTRVTFGLFACIEGGIIAMACAASRRRGLLTELT